MLNILNFYYLLMYMFFVDLFILLKKNTFSPVIEKNLTKIKKLPPPSRDNQI